jgi:hypothetical protein
VLTLSGLCHQAARVLFAKDRLQACTQHTVTHMLVIMCTPDQLLPRIQLSAVCTPATAEGPAAGLAGSQLQELAWATGPGPPRCLYRHSVCMRGSVLSDYVHL